MGFTGLDNLHILTSGKPLPNVILLLDSPLWPQLIAEWKENFDFVILDTPPVLLFVDAIIAGKASDGVLLVYRSGMISRLALKRASNQLTAGGTRIIGIALNDARTSVLSPHYSYYSDYGHYMDKMDPDSKPST
jgi:Mrp family chromosome partitioning ATPase